MGATNFYNRMIASSEEEAFEKLVKEAEREYGEDLYNGTISTCALGRCVYQFDKCTKANLRKADKIIKKSALLKRVANYIDCGVVNYELITKKKKKSKGTSYLVSFVNKNGLTEMESFSTIVEAENFAETKIRQGRSHVNIAKAIKMHEYITDTKVKKTQPKKVSKNTVVKENRLYIFFGLAAE